MKSSENIITYFFRYVTISMERMDEVKKKNKMRPREGKREREQIKIWSENGVEITKPKIIKYRHSAI